MARRLEVLLLIRSCSTPCEQQRIHTVVESDLAGRIDGATEEQAVMQGSFSGGWR